MIIEINKFARAIWKLIFNQSPDNMSSQSPEKFGRGGGINCRQKYKIVGVGLQICDYNVIVTVLRIVTIYKLMMSSHVVDKWERRRSVRIGLIRKKKGVCEN